MEISLRTPGGALVEIKPTYFIDDLPHPRNMKLKLTAPLLDMDSDSQTDVTGKSIFGTRFLLIKDDTSTFGVFLILDGRHATVLLADIQNPLMLAWQRTALHVGYLPMLLKRESEASLLEFPIDEDMTDAFASLNPHPLATVDATQRAVNATMALAESIERLPQFLPADFHMQSMHIHVIASQACIAPQNLH